jgi:hypothetical protein
MFMPSGRVWTEMKCESASFWPVPINHGNEYAFLLKVPTHVIKAAYRLAPVTLSVASAATPIGNVMATVMAVADDPAAPLGVAGVHRHVEEQIALKEVLRSGQTLFVFFDELSRPLARACCTLESNACHRAFAEIDTKEWYAGPWITALEEVLDEVEKIVDPRSSAPTLRFRHLCTVTKIDLTLSEFETTNISAIGQHEVHQFRLEDINEGAGLEQTTWHLLEDLFGQNIFRSPQVQESKGRRELTDILSFCNLGQCVIETKAMAVLSTEMGRSTERIASNIQQQINKGIKQVRGAMRNLSADVPMLSLDGNKITFPPDIARFRIGIIMVSELLPAVDWCAVAKRLIEAAKQADAPMLVLDLQELRLLVGTSKTPEDLIAHLLRRFLIMRDKGSALIRTRVEGPFPP